MKVGLIQSIRLPNQSLRIMAEILREYDIDPIPLIIESGLVPEILDDPWGSLNGHQELAFQRLFWQNTKHIPAIGFLTGLRYSLIAYGPLGLAALVSRNVTEGLRTFTTMQALGYALIEYDILEEDGIAVAFIANDEYVPADLKEFMHERLLGSGPTFFRDMRQENLPLRLIESRLDRPKGWMGIEDRWQVDIAYRAERNCIHFAEGTGALPLPLANPLLAENYKKLCQNILETSPKHNGIVKSVYQLLMESRGAFPNAQQAARALNASERSLHRKLAEANSSYRQILDNVRLRRARELLDNTNLPMSEISDRLGFAEMASFSRFFRRVGGLAPSNYRKNGLRIFAASNDDGSLQ
ncbi:helix-turn-helix domain-containing protein [Sulfitobacter pseudonitzschiae]|uniref:Helix-turn-helix domain-containing protein n=2 Tax=Pseudosulfitobacter pseudonitzschiae TaxID=1402135 RepID=A0A9Q2MY08_9RHOB|nr:AraC family transcriptional regulator [Pseudosulfitobacter pseudonitzschiae]MBM1818003.1 helix-turn-helix domain-containing protein [Pseudosulfitobacter pseudonitzschiae]MBM1834818.1 helix-turn-helix domain-containing protein [Pseudosulfitobacter pseudonitzschiae]MBM1839862.1 helix-turn-helix domain-containing protein [Pseudosulfitobacter pseudonitzschiae]MBM1844533.1 helix-turn-helix domain-containing protein [Pseudosulfitobacter pseudonitzschiae]MBM1849516.1 helix-turn-helix domain-contai